MDRAIITGASSGIGAEMAREMARRGYAVALLARRADLLQGLAKKLANAVALPCDVTDEAAVTSAVRAGEKALGGPFYQSDCQGQFSSLLIALSSFFLTIRSDRPDG